VRHWVGRNLGEVFISLASVAAVLALTGLLWLVNA
jgi:hypothetical protein